MPIREYREFELEASDFERDEGGVERFSVKVSSSPAGESTGKTERDIPPDLRKELRLLERRKLDADDVISLGEKLADLLLPDEARWLFRGSKSMLGRNQGLRLRLRLDPALAGIPWEYMFVPRAGGGKNPADFLVLDPLISIARHEAVPVPGDFDDTPKRRRLLVALASPQGNEPLDLARERDNLVEALRDVPDVELDFVENATVQALRDKLETDADIFHFAGHGTFTGKRMSEAFGTMDGEGAILLVGEDGRAATTKAAMLEVMLRGHGVQLVVLGACQTGQPGAGSVWSSVAAALMKAGIPAAVAMQYGIWDDAAIAFNRSFYRALAAGLPLDYAVSAGRQAAFCLCHPLCDDEEKGGYYRDWGVPVLYLRARKEFVLPAIPDAGQRKKQVRKVQLEAGLEDGIRRWTYKAAAAVVVGAGLVVALFWWPGYCVPLKVPDVTRYPEVKAERELGDKGFTVRIVRDSSEDVPKGYVIETQPGADEKPGKNKEVRVVVSTGPLEHKIPTEVKGKTEAVARGILEGPPYNFKVKKKAVEEGSEKWDKGYVTRTYPPVDEDARAGTEITLYVSTGKAPELVKIPPPKSGENATDYGDRLIKDGFIVARVPKRIADENVKKGYLIGTEPAVGTEITKDREITLAVSTGPPSPPGRTIRNYAGDNYKTAEKELKDTGFDVVVKKTPSYTVERDRVISQRPAGKVDAATKKVTLVVSVGKYCPKCGRELEENTDRCENCGESW